MRRPVSAAVLAAACATFLTACGEGGPVDPGTPEATAPAVARDVKPAGPTTFADVVREGGDQLATFVEGPRHGRPLASAVIRPEGGTVTLGAWEIVVPPGAVDRPTLFMIRRPSGPAAAYDLVELLPHAKKVFLVPVTVRMPLAGTTLQGDPDATVSSWDEDAERWIPAATRVIEDGARIEARVSHFSYWGVSFRRGELSSGGR